MKRRFCAKLTALLLTLLMLFGGAMPAVYAAATGEPAPTAYDALQVLAASDEPYQLPAEAQDAVYVPLTLLQTGSLEASWKGSELNAQASDGQDAFVAALEKFEPGVNLQPYGLTQQQTVDIMNNTINTRPDLFYIEGVYMRLSGGKVIYAWFWYTAAISVVKAQAGLLEAEIQYVLGLVPSGLNKVEKVLWVNDYLALTTYYPDLNKSDLASYYTVYGILVNGIGVCQGFALANCLLLERLGVTCGFVTSDYMNHAWNLVRLDDGHWYHVDTTWNDGPSEYGYLDLNGYVNHDYFLLSDAVMRDAAHAHSNWNAPAAASSNTYRNYFWTQTTSAIVPLDGKWYYFEDDYTWSVVDTGVSNDYTLYAYDFGTNTSTAVKDFTQTVSPAPASLTRFASYRLTPSLAVHDGMLYANDGTTIFKMDADGENQAVVATVKLPNGSALNESNYQCITGFGVRHGQIYYGLFDRSGGRSNHYRDLEGPVLAPAPSLPAVHDFEVNVFSIALRYGTTYKITATPAATRFEPEDKSLVSVSPDGVVSNIAFGEEAFTGVWVYGPNNSSAYVVVTVYTEWWQWIIWIVLFGWIWY